MALVAYEKADGFAVLTMDDGKVNVLSPAMLAELGAALDRAEADGSVVVITGRDGMFSAGFDLRVLRGGGVEAADMLRAGFDLAERLLSFPRPVVAACTGHAVAMATFVLLSCDYRIGAEGDFRLTANEVAIGLTMPRAAIELCRQRLAPAHLGLAVALSEVFTPTQAVTAGFLDRVVEPAAVATTAREVAGLLATLDAAAHTATKLRLREQTLAALRSAIEADDAEVRATLAG